MLSIAALRSEKLEWEDDTSLAGLHSEERSVNSERFGNGHEMAGRVEKILARLFRLRNTGGSSRTKLPRRARQFLKCARK
jgi:hypothetical protein